MRYFWYDECSFCHQGRLVIARDVSRDRLYLHCGECERCWVDPETVSDPALSFLALTEEFDVVFPTEEEVVERGWARYLRHSYEA
jgi:hypothetical protein